MSWVAVVPHRECVLAAAQAESDEIRSRHESDRAALLAEAQQRCAAAEAAAAAAQEQCTIAEATAAAAQEAAQQRCDAAEAAAAAAQDAARATETAREQETAELRRRLVRPYADHFMYHSPPCF